MRPPAKQAENPSGDRPGALMRAGFNEAACKTGGKLRPGRPPSAIGGRFNEAACKTGGKPVGVDLADRIQELLQ